MTTLHLLSIYPFAGVALAAILPSDFRLLMAESPEEVIGRIENSDQVICLVDMTANISLCDIQAIRTAAPRARVVLWAEEVSIELAAQAMGAGVYGVLRKSLPPATLVDVLHSVAAGELCFDKSITDAYISARQVRLTPREAQLCALLAMGLRNKEMGYALEISEGTVKVYLSRLFDKTGCEDRLELALWTMKNFGGARVGTIQEQAVNPTLRMILVPKEPPTTESGRLRPMRGIEGTRSQKLA